MANEITTADAINSLDAAAQFSIIHEASGDVITWDSSEISQANIDTEKTRLQAEYDGNAHQRTRATAYEEVKEQLDQLYHDMTAGKLDATGEWHKAIKAVKDATPKPV
mgnify:CR=1 FL=1|jgi:hypothetical protein